VVVHEPGRVRDAEAAAVEVHNDGRLPLASPGSCTAAVGMQARRLDSPGRSWSVLHQGKRLGRARPGAVDAAVDKHAQPANTSSTTLQWLGTTCDSVAVAIVVAAG
jgi:hypothetical protein